MIKSKTEMIDDLIDNLLFEGIIKVNDDIKLFNELSMLIDTAIETYIDSITRSKKDAEL